jgi:hypothetical protein
VLATFAALAVVPSPARGGDVVARPSFEWIAPPDCPGREDFLARIDQRLGRAARSSSRHPFAARAVVSPVEGGGYRARIETQSERSSNERVLEGSTCEKIADEVAHAIAVALDPDAAGARAEPLPEEGPRPLQVALRLSACADVGSLPSPGAGPGLAAALVFRRYRLEVSGAYFLTQQVRRAGDPPISDEPMPSELQLSSLGLRGCAFFVVDGLEPGVCAGVEGSLLRVRSTASRPESVHHVWIGALGGLSVAYAPLSWARLRLGLEGGPSFLTPEVALPRLVPHRIASIVARGSIGVELVR